METVLTYAPGTTVGEVIEFQREERAEYLANLKTVLDDLLASGGLCLWATKQHGKSNSLFEISKALTQLYPEKNINVLCFDTALNWVFKYPTKGFYKIVFGGNPQIDYSRIARLVQKDTNIIFDLTHIRNIQNRTSITNFVVNVARTLAEKQKRKKGTTTREFVFIIEEIQNVLGEYFLRSIEGRRFRAVHSEAKNFGMNFLYSCQRINEIPTGMVERDLLLIGRVGGANDLRKLRLLTSSEIRDNIKNYPRGTFYYHGLKQTISALKFPKFSKAPYTETEKEIFNNGYNSR